MVAAVLSEEAPGAKVFAFVFPLASGHINPSFPIARSLVREGHEVHYLCREQMRSAIEGTGARFHSDVEVEPELFEGREPDMMGAMESLKVEFGLESENMMTAWSKLAAIQMELKLPGVRRWLRAIGASVVMYCPLMTPEAAYAAEILGVPSVALLTLAGPGSLERTCAEMTTAFGIKMEELRDAVRAYEPNAEAVQRLREKFGVSYDSNLEEPFGRMGVLRHSRVTLVTTSEELQDPASDELSEAYRRDGVRFVAVGPLLDEPGAARAAGHREKQTEGDKVSHAEGSEVVSRVRAAKSAGRPVVLVSMGTVITGDNTSFGWEGRLTGADGKPRGLTGRELCQGAWAGAFDAFGSATTEEGPLLVVALGPQERPLGPLTPPANAVCLPVLPQVDILQAGVDLFLTHGGQNSTMEGLSSGVPLVVCPGFGDQVVNAGKVEALGVGLQVPRPDPDEGEEAAAADMYRADVARVLARVYSEGTFASAAARCAEGLRSSTGVPGAVEWMLTAATECKQGLGNKAAEEPSLHRSLAVKCAGA